MVIPETQHQALKPWGYRGGGWVPGASPPANQQCPFCLQVPVMPSLRARPDEAEMEPSVPGLSPCTPSAQACVSDATTMTNPASAFCEPLDCSDTELGVTPPHHQQPGTGTEFPTGHPDYPGVLSVALWFPSLTYRSVV